ncbi:MAG: hypothetical protein SFV81_23380, partial [Pirellulaceae bacterium]|nr:hypothetical protein [Pirellulaceae bacterium]
IVESKAFEEAMKTALLRDIVVRVNWTGDADLDLRVREPAGTICSLKNPQSIGGGVLLGDASSVSESAKLGGFSEYYVCSQGYAGQYDILVRRVWGEVTGGKATVEIYTDYGTPDQKLIVKQLDLSEKDSLIQVAVKNGHRKEPIATAQIAQAQKQRIEASRAVLGQFGGDSSSSGSSSSSTFESWQQLRQMIANNNRLRFPGGGAVGYQPVITTIPSGTFFSVAGVVSADRRYVRIAPQPMFSDIGQVTTFNFVSGNTGTSGAGGQGGGFGGGGIGGGGGGGGLF